MSYFTIPTDTTSTYYEMVTQLEGIEYALTFLWSDREEAFYLNLSDTDGNPIATGIKLVTSWPLLRRFTDPRLPPGRLILIDTSGNFEELDAIANMGVGLRWQLTYVTSDDPDCALIDSLITG